VDIAVKRKLVLDSLYACVLTQPTLINKRKKALFPIVLQCEQLADGVSRILAQLGLERRHKVRTIGEILSREHDEHETRTNGAEQGNGTT
jgi:hypothetical protein